MASLPLFALASFWIVNSEDWQLAALLSVARSVAPVSHRPSNKKKPRNFGPLFGPADVACFTLDVWRLVFRVRRASNLCHPREAGIYAT
jgi:hypothetical protein